MSRWVVLEGALALVLATLLAMLLMGSLVGPPRTLGPAFVSGWLLVLTGFFAYRPLKWLLSPGGEAGGS